MPKLIIEITRDESIARQYLKNPFLWMYLKGQKELFVILSSWKQIREHRKEITDTKALFIEEGDKEKIDREKKEIDDFFFKEESKLDKNAEYTKIIKDGRLKQIVNKIKSLKQIGGNTFLNACIRFGISVVWKVED